MDAPQIEFKINSQGQIISEGGKNIKDLYLNKSIKQKKKRGAANPIKYVL